MSITYLKWRKLVKRCGTCNQLEHRDSKAPDISLEVVASILLDHFWRHKTNRTDKRVPRSFLR